MDLGHLRYLYTRKGMRLSRLRGSLPDVSLKQSLRTWALRPGCCPARVFGGEDQGLAQLLRK